MRDMSLLRIKILIILIIMVGYQNTFATDMRQEVAVTMGMVNVGFAETESVIEADDSMTTIDEEVTAQSGTVSVLTLDLSYVFLSYPTKSFYGKVAVPLISSGGTGYFVAGIGMNFFISSLSSKMSTRDKSTTFEIIPKFRYYWGPEIGAGYLIYATDTAEKSDLLFELGVHGGVIYNFRKTWGMKAEFTIARGTGVATTTMNMKIMFGITYFL